MFRRSAWARRFGCALEGVLGGWWIERPFNGGGVAKTGYIGTLRNRNDDLIRLSGDQIVPFESTAYPARLYSDDRVVLCVEGRIPREDLLCNRVGFEVVCSSRERLLNNILQELRPRSGARNSSLARIRSSCSLISRVSGGDALSPPLARALCIVSPARPCQPSYPLVCSCILRLSI